jgi:hypothetical protein
MQPNIKILKCWEKTETNDNKFLEISRKF